MPRIIVIHDGTIREDILEVELYEDVMIFTAQDNVDRDGVCVSILLNERGIKRLREHVDQYFGDYPRQQVTQLNERLENAEQENRELKALVQILAEGKDLLRRELDQVTRLDCQHPDHDDHLICQGCGECREDLDADDYCAECSDPHLP